MLSWGNAHYIHRTMIQRGAALSWEQRIRDAVIADALRFNDLTLWSLRAALINDPPGDVAVLIGDALQAALAAATPRAAAGTSPGKGRATAAADRFRPQAARVARGLVRIVRGSRRRQPAAPVDVTPQIAAIAERLEGIEDSLAESQAYIGRAIRDVRSERSSADQGE